MWHFKVDRNHNIGGSEIDTFHSSHKRKQEHYKRVLFHSLFSSHPFIDHGKAMEESITPQPIVVKKPEILDPSIECCICFDSIEYVQENARVFICGHGDFHDKCIQNWTSINSSCPVCRCKEKDDRTNK